jgi:hypothetical protein
MNGIDGVLQELQYPCSNILSVAFTAGAVMVNPYVVKLPQRPPPHYALQVKLFLH